MFMHSGLPIVSSRCVAKKTSSTANKSFGLLRKLATVVAVMLLAGNVAGAQGLGVVGNLVGLLGSSPVLEVQTVVPGGLASRVGVFPGDSIISINGVAPGDATVNQRAIALGGGRLAIVVQRNGTLINLGNDQLGGNFGGSGFGNSGFGDSRFGHSGFDHSRFGNSRFGNSGFGNSGFGNSGFGNSGFGSAPFVPNNVEGNRLQLTPGRPGPNLQMTLESSRGFSGVQVSRVVHGGLGDQLRFQAGDVITSVNERPVNTTAQFSEAYVANNRRQIVFGVLRRGRAGTVTLSEQALRRAALPAGAISTELGLTTFYDREGKVTVAGGSKDGLGAQLGIATRGTRILEINGQPIRTPAEVKRIDDEIAAGRMTRLVINIIRPDGTRDTVSYAASSQTSRPRINARPTGSDFPIGFGNTR